MLGGERLHGQRRLRPRVLDHVALVQDEVVPVLGGQELAVVAHDLVAGDDDVVAGEAGADLGAGGRGAEVDQGGEEGGGEVGADEPLDLGLPVGAEGRRADDQGAELSIPRGTESN